MYAVLIANILFIVLTFAFDAWSGKKRTSTKIILYEKIENIVPERRAELIEDLKQRTGLEIVDLEIGHIDFLRDVAYINVKYVLKKGESNSIDQIVRFK